AGLTAAFGFARAGFDVVCCGAAERTGGGRTVALLDQSVGFLKSLGLWARLEPQAAPLRGLRLIDDTGTLFPPRPVEFHASEIDLDAFGWNIENDRMAEALAAEITGLAGLERIATGVAAYDFDPEAVHAQLEDGRLIAARLAIGADGRASRARRAAGLEARVHRYPQTALTAHLAHRLPHDDFSTEFHTRSGPFTLVPLPPSAAAPNRSSLVWVMGQEEARRRKELDDEALAREIELEAHSLLGAIRIEGERGFFPMARQIVPKIAGERLALVGDAAHVLPPIGAQGLNLGLRDIAAMIACAVDARAEGRDIGGPEALRAYERARRADIAFRTGAVDGLNRALLAHFGPLDFLRGAGLSTLSSIPPLRRLVMQAGIGPR
ncbi:MAG: FAD-dependent monooxygenase, partial [Hyphomicrobiales bacterium]|nr:FAD-dependent monooxygenase [Hyphomicrobiales bacterium]